jgi:N-acyl-L-homoserine lactone synthetase
MGKLVNAGKLLKAIEGAGSDMKLPNIYVAPSQEAVIELSRFFIDGDKLTYTSSVDNAEIAKSVINGTEMTVTGVAEGFTLLNVTVADKTYTINITVRNAANNNGWM